MLAFHGGKDLIVYPDGLAMAADLQKEIREQWDAGSPEEIEAVITKHGLKKGCPTSTSRKTCWKRRTDSACSSTRTKAEEIVTANSRPSSLG